MDAIARKRHHESFVSGIIRENPLFVAVLGMCPALAVTTTLEAAIGMGFLFSFVLICSNVLISALRKVIPEEIETPAYIVVVATFVTIVKMLCEAYLPNLYETLGVFLALIVVNCIVLGRAEAFANKNTVLDSFLDGCGNGIGYTLGLIAIAFCREVLGTGMITFGDIFTFLKVNGESVHLYLLKGPSWDYSLYLFTTPAGGFIVFGLIMGFIAYRANKKKDRAAAERRAKAFAAAEAKPTGPLSGATKPVSPTKAAPIKEGGAE
ncbi:MAG: electron transport complex subunit RsxE [Bacilli bacterium]|jgi:electron transport complex protein RnfE|nr:electron transport complex subunit RsxE [Bacilli bacterium]